MRNHLPLMVLFIIIILFVFIIYFKKEGFTNAEVHSNYVALQEKNYSPIGISLIAAKTQGALGDSADDIMGTFGSSKKYPLNPKKTGLFATIAKCEAVKTNSAGAFDDPEFAKDCGLCMDIGTNSDNQATSGGLVLLKEDKDYAKSQTKNNSIPNYKATVGSCPANRLVSTKAEAIRLKRKLDCEKAGSYDLAECSQCYSDQSYTIVDSDPASGVMAGTGTLYVVGKGTLSYSESGYSSKSGITLSSTPHAIKLEGPEATRVTMTITAPSDGSTPSIAGYLSGKTATGEFVLDLYRIVLTDMVTGRKPRTSDMITVNGNDVSTMDPGFGKDQMKLILPMPFTFVDSNTQQASECKDSPFVTKQASSEFLNSDPCYKKGSGPGKYNLECLQSLFLSNGCIEDGKAYPKDVASAAKLMTGKGGSFLTLNQLATMIYGNAVSASTGIGPNGAKLEVTDWSNASEFCTGKTITSPCDTPAKTLGPLSTDCLAYLWENGGGKKNAAGVVDEKEATYSLLSMATSLFTKKDAGSRFCQATGTLSPIDANGKANQAAINYWKGKGGVQAVKAIMNNIHAMANKVGLSDSQRIEYLQQCYGVDKLAAPVLGPGLPDTPAVPTPGQRFELTNGRIAGYVDLNSQDYTLSFDIILKGAVSNWGNIIHVTQGENWGWNGERSPGIWFWPNETAMHIVYGKDNSGITKTDPIPLNKKVNFNLTVAGGQVTLVLNGKTYSQAATARATGNGFKVYMADPWHQAANATILDLKYAVGGKPVNLLPTGGYTPANAPLSIFQNMFNAAGCKKTLAEADIPWWRKQTWDTVAKDMGAYASLTSNCSGNQNQHDFCAPGKCIAAPVPFTRLDLKTEVVDLGVDRTTVTVVGTVPFLRLSEHMGGRIGAYFDGSLDNYIKFEYRRWDVWTASWWFCTMDYGGYYYTMASITGSDWVPVFQADLDPNMVRNIVALPNHWTDIKDIALKTPWTWQHVTYTYSAAAKTCEIYVNGEFKGKSTGSAVLRSAPNPVFILGRSGDHGRGFKGMISEFKMFYGVLNASQIRDIYTQSKVQPAYNCATGADHADGCDTWCKENMTADIVQKACDDDPTCKSWNIWNGTNGCIKKHSNFTNYNKIVNTWCVKNDAYRYVMYGPWIGRDVVVDRIFYLGNKKIFLIQEGIYAKMVANGVAYYYEGSADHFNIKKMSSYNVAPKGVYKIRIVDTKVPVQDAAGNNGTVTCDMYCKGAGGGSWGGQLPAGWNGARCIGCSSNPDLGCDKGSSSAMTCKCEMTNGGWISNGTPWTTEKPGEY